MPGRKTRQWSYVVTVYGYSTAHGHTNEAARAQCADMLRYDVATITEELPDRSYRIVGTQYPTVERWRSFGIGVSEIQPVNTPGPSEVIRVRAP